MNDFDKLILEIKKMGGNPSYILNDILNTPLTNENARSIYITLYNLLYNGAAINSWNIKNDYAMFVDSPITRVDYLMEKSNSDINTVCKNLLDNKDLLKKFIDIIISDKYGNIEITNKINSCAKEDVLKKTIQAYTTPEYYNDMYKLASETFKNQLNKLPVLSRLCLPTCEKYDGNQAVEAVYRFITSPEDPNSTILFTGVSRDEVKECGRDRLLVEVIKNITQLEHEQRKNQPGDPLSNEQRAISSLIYDNIKTYSLDQLLPFIENSKPYLREVIRMAVKQAVRPQISPIDQELTPLLQYIDGLAMSTKPTTKS